jgi:hypothetical protein
MELKEPVEYEEFIHFGSIESWHTEAIVLSQQKGRIVTDEDTPYVSGVRIYLDNHKPIRSGMAGRDGLHLIKVKQRLPLTDFLIESISTDVLDPHQSVEEWTPMTFFREAGCVLMGAMPPQSTQNIPPPCPITPRQPYTPRPALPNGYGSPAENLPPSDHGA